MAQFEIRPLDRVVKLEAEFADITGSIPPATTKKFGEIVCPQPPIATRIRIIAGEAANCFRSALDYLVRQMAILDSPGIAPKRTQFVITKSKEAFQKSVSQYLIGLNAAHVAAVERLQPWSCAIFESKRR